MKLLWIVFKSFAIWIVFSGCTIDLELTSQRTALENQIIGTFKQLDDDVILISSVRALDQDGKVKKEHISSSHQKALRAKQNQQFNTDDLNELKDLGLLGEAEDGTVIKLTVNKDIDNQKPSLLQLLDIIIKEENRDRMIIWHRMIELNPDLSSAHLEAIRKTYADQKWQEARPSHWHQRQGKWYQKQ